MHFAFNQKGVKLILAARKYGKSDYITVLGTVWHLIQNPGARILIVVKEFKRGIGIMEAIINSLRLLNIRMSSENKTGVRLKSLPNWSKDNSVGLATIRAKSLRGLHPDKIIMDDPITPADSSERERDQVQKIYSECLNLTQDITVIGQPVHELDLYQTLREAKKVEKVEMWYGSIPELDVDIEELREQGTTEREIQANYFGKLISDSSQPFADIKVRSFIFEKNCTAFLDIAFDGEDSNAITIGFYHYDKGVTYYLAVVYQFKESIFNNIGTVIELCLKYNVDTLWVEKNADHGATKLFLKEELRRRSLSTKIWVKDVTIHVNKYERIIRTISPKLHKIILHSDTNCLMDIRLWNKQAKHDDAVDSLASFIMAENNFKDLKTNKK